MLQRMFLQRVCGLACCFSGTYNELAGGARGGRREEGGGVNGGWLVKQEHDRGGA